MACKNQSRQDGHAGYGHFFKNASASSLTDDEARIWPSLWLEAKLKMSDASVILSESDDGGRNHG